ncbi:MAG: MBL fold metallo-hydrolase [Prevotellaceae bacterium]|jgi:L-ascorbate metabolism protein UlaG (beta-lactamase superfamily)|nr:MBL fold metallo-hydrolase [Prevotellaceae bacterium]
MAKSRILKAISLIFYILFANCLLIAQQSLQYWDNPDIMLQDQASILFEQVYEVLESNPPSTLANDERKLALFALDALFHDTRLDNSAAFFAYTERMAQTIVEELSKGKPVDNKARFFRFYNHGFIVQTPSVTVAIDIIRGGGHKEGKHFISDSLMRLIVKQCDILFITHAHGDHADEAVAGMFCNQGKNVIVPPELWKNSDSHIRHLRGTDMLKETIRIASKNVTLPVRIFPGHQREVPNNIYAITMPEGITVMHTGDQSHGGDMKWITNIGDKVKVDVLLAHCWMMPMEESVAGIRPALIITGHENEMGHSIDHRESYWLTFRRMENVKVPYVVMAWGEKLVWENGKPYAL